MNEPRPQEDVVSARRRKVKRAKRGLIAGYIHEISGRHNGARSVVEGVAEPSAGEGEAQGVAS
jgi:hypothetical protein